MHVKGHKISFFEKGRVIELHGQGKTQNEIVSLTGISKGVVNRLIKNRGLSRPQGRGNVSPLRPVNVKKVTVNSPVRDKVDRPSRPINLTVIDEKRLPELKVNGQGQPHLTSPHLKGQVIHGQERSKSLSIGGCVFIILLIIGVCVLVAWVYLTPEISKAKENPEPEIKKTFGYEGRSLEELNESRGFDTTEDIPDEF